VKAADQSRDEPGVRRVRMHDPGVERDDGCLNVGVGAPEPEADARSAKRRHDCHLCALLAGSLHGGSSASRHDGDVVAGRDLCSRELHDMCLGTTDVASRDHMNDAHHQPTAATHRSCQWSYA
jgi:hypothetical protein